MTAAGVIAPVVLPSTADRSIAHAGVRLLTREPLPLPDLPAQRTSAVVYGASAVDDRGRVVDRVVLRALGWSAGHRLDIRESAGTLTVVPDPAGGHQVGRYGGEVRVWDPATGATLTGYTGHTGGVSALAWSPDGTRLATGDSGDGGYHSRGDVRVWDPTTGTTLSTLTGQTGGVSRVAWSPDGTRLASSGGQGGKVWVSDPSTGTIITTLTGHTGRVTAVTWSPDGSRLASGADDSTVRVWEPTTGTIITTLSGHIGVAWAVAWSPDGTRLAIGDGGHDGEVLVWDPTTGHTATLSSHTGGVRALEWSPDGTRVATAGYDGVVRVSDPHCGARAMYLHLDPSTCMAVSSAGIAIGGPWGIGLIDIVAN